jgi:curved DNA-binding protein CbpA
MEHSAGATDHYETLQVSKNADQDTVQRVFRMLAQRFHPDNPDTGNEEHFRRIHEAYIILSDPEKRAQYDIFHDTSQKERWQFVAAGPPADNDFTLEQHLRFVVLEILYSRRRTEPEKPALSNLDLSRLTGRPREHLEFTLWYLIQRELISRNDQSSLTITAAGVDFVEANTHIRRQPLRIAAGNKQ